MLKNKPRIMILIILALMISLIAACQPTPEIKNIVAKDGALEEIIENEQAEVLKYDFPQNFNEKYIVTDKLDVDVDADISIPSFSLYPVYNVAFAPFSPEQASSLIKTFFGDTKVYKKSGIRTKDVIEAEIVNWKRLAADVAAGTQNGDLNSYEEIIHQLENELASAPEATADIPYDGLMDSSEEGSYLIVHGNTGHARDATLEIRNYENTNSAFMFYQNGTEYWSDGGVNEQADGLSLTPQDAIDLVSQWLHSAGMDDISPVFCHVGSSYQSGDVKGKEGYVVNCERQIEGIPVTYNLNGIPSGSLNDIPDYHQLFIDEKLTFTIDDTEITTIKWENPFKIEMKNKNVKLLSFEDVAKYFTQGVKYIYSWVEDANGVEGTTDAVTIEVTKIKLGLAVVPEKDKAGNFMLVPAWDFFGTESSLRDGEAGVVAFDDRSFVTINAIDGSIIG